MLRISQDDLQTKAWLLEYSMKFLLNNLFRILIHYSFALFCLLFFNLWQYLDMTDPIKFQSVGDHYQLTMSQLRVSWSLAARLLG